MGYDPVSGLVSQSYGPLSARESEHFTRPTAARWQPERDWTKSLAKAHRRGLTFADESVSAREAVRAGGRSGRCGRVVGLASRRANRRRMVSTRLGVKRHDQSGHGAVVAQRTGAEASGSFGRHGADPSVGRRPFVDFASFQVQIQGQMIAISATGK